MLEQIGELDSVEKKRIESMWSCPYCNAKTISKIKDERIIDGLLQPFYACIDCTQESTEFLLQLATSTSDEKFDYRLKVLHIE
jgi:DNA-directed RNA polymerase subunit RPC12/RpoP